MTGTGMPSWLLSQGHVLLRRFVRNKDEPLCDDVFLLDASPTYARIQWPNRKEDTVSTSDLAPCPVPSENKVNPTTSQSEQRVDKPNAEITVSPNACKVLNILNLHGKARLKLQLKTLLLTDG